MSKITRLKNDIITFLETYSSFEIDEEWEVNLSNFEELLEEAESILIDLGSLGVSTDIERDYKN